MARRRAGSGGGRFGDVLLIGGLAFILYKAGALGSIGIGNAGGVPTMTQAQLATVNQLVGTGVIPLGVLTNGTLAMSDGSTILPNGQLVAA